MSLINDLVIEIDRREARKRRTGDSPLEGLSPGRPAPRLPRRHRMLSEIAVLLIGFALVVGVAIGVWHARTAVEGPTLSDDALAERPDRPPVSSAPRVPSAALPVLPGPDRGTTARSVSADDDRPSATIESIDLIRRGATSRLRILADRPATYRIEPRADEREIEILLESVGTGLPMPDLDLMDTPIRSIQAHSSSRGFRLSLRLDRAVRIQSHWIDEDGRAVLVVDLQGTDPSGRSESAETDGQDIGRRESGTEEASVLEIARSADDRQRKTLERLDARARRTLDAARQARFRNDLEEADRLYRQVLEDRPGDREAILERTALLATLDRPSEALDFIRMARRKQPMESAFVMLEARLIAGTGDLDSAIRILDAAGFDPALAPDVHALASAYLQRAGRHERAIERYQAILRLHPDESRWWMGLGISLEALNQKAEALDAYRIAMRVGELPGGTRHWVSARIADLGEGG